MYVIGTRRRMIIVIGGTPMTIIIRRLRCKKCGKIHHELPDKIIPYKRYCAETIEKIIGGNDDEGHLGVAERMELSTIRRLKVWWASLQLYLESVLESLSEKYGVLVSVKSAPREIVRAVVNSNLWLHTRSAFLSG